MGKQPQKVVNYVKFYRRLNNLSQQDLGALVGKSGQVIGHLESGQSTNPNIVLCLSLAAVFGLSVEELFFFSGEEPQKRLALREGVYRAAR